MKKKLLFLIPAFVGMSVFTQAQQKVGVNTNTPEATLDIHGNMAIEKVDVAKNNDTPQQLVWNSNTREVQVKQLNKNFFLIDYRIEAGEADDWKSQARQWVSNFDTKIPLDYNVIFATVTPLDRDRRFNLIDIMHSQGSNNNPVDIVPGLSKLKPIEKGHREDTTTADEDALRVNPIVRKVLWEDTNTKSWHFTLGFPGGRPDNINAGSIYKKHKHRICYEWQVRLVAIPKQTSEVISREAYLEASDKTDWNPDGKLDGNPLN